MITGWYAVVGRTWPSCRLAPRAGMVQLYDPLDYSHGVYIGTVPVQLQLYSAVRYCAPEVAKAIMGRSG